MYTRRATTDTVHGRMPHKGCPCLMLMVLFADETLDGGEVWHMLCPSCAAGWVREPPSDYSLLSVAPERSEGPSPR